MRQVGVYARISSDPDGTRLGVERQVADCRALTERLGWSVGDEYVDNDVSAWSGETRREYRRLLDDLKNRVITGVVVWHADRLHRHPAELEEFIALIEGIGDVAVETVTAGDLDLSTPTGRTVARILGAVARQESDNKSLRLRRKADETAMKGRVSGGGARPYGFEVDRVTVVAAEAAVIREAAARVLAGESVRSVAGDLNDRGFTTSTGGLWTAGTVSRMLRSARISGRREHHGEIVADAVWPPIITPAHSDRLRRLLGGRSRPRARTARSYLLTGGLLRCGRCDTPLVSRPTASGTRRYVCSSSPGSPGCGRLAINAEPLESFVAQAVLHRLDTPQLRAALTDARRHDSQQAQLADQIAADEEMLAQIADDYAQRTITHAEWLAARTPITARVDAAKRSLSRLSGTAVIDDYAGKATVLRDAWADLAFTRQQAIIRAIIDHIVVSPASPGRNSFDPNRLTPTWRL